MTTVSYDFQLKQQPLANAQSSINLNDPKNRIVLDWYYSSPYLLVAALSDLNQLSLTWYKGDQMQSEIILDSPDKTSQAFYEASFYPHNESTLLLFTKMKRRYGGIEPLFLHHLYLISLDGKVLPLSDRISNEVLDILVLQEDHGEFKREGILVLQEGNQIDTPILLYIDPDNSSSLHVLPKQSNRWEFSGLTESAETIHLEKTKNNFGVTSLGFWNFIVPEAPPTPMPRVATTPQITNTTNTTNNKSTSTSLTSVQTTQTSFFWNKTTNSNSKPNTLEVLGIVGAGFLLSILASSLACCLSLRARKAKNEQADKSVPLSGLENGPG